ncbi:hypothetical protein PRZ48_013941 [Zasmidium cellare]|uniref:Uncharacterized protein n=1 Tax=Zasmidium cellare TaxID=395010 RepID=A0ABR0DZL7_ZASCE|nr:hypothetical protein PRZ48_013941 [Zasmidium cellare]
MPSESFQDSEPPPLSSTSVLPPATNSDNQSCVAADPKTVMAEQSGHNVVSNSQSTSGSPLVDVAATTTTTDDALSGTQPPTNAETTSARPELSKSAAESAPDNSLAGPDATNKAAEPSAGDAAIAAADDASANHVDGRPGAGSDLVNGIRDDASQGDVRDDRSNADVSVDVSINSDTDNSRGDAFEKKDGHHHTRTNSVKKPTTFSKVTATKNFMNKIAPVAPTAPKVGEKPSPVAAAVMQPSSRPRLVAKTGASLASLQSKRTGEGPSGPDASKVWNKNRPVQPPPPKQFTDEELKQQYGIHLATRLQTDEGGKESKWADIDDDEDDWAPETVVWMDGTKSNIAPQDAVPAKDAEPEQKPAATQPAKPAEGTRPTLSLKSSRPEQAMRILKPGVAAIQAKQNEQSPSLTPGTDRPSLKAKSPAPAPAKSPWAPVPKVDSVSPINPPIQQQQQPPVRAPLATQDARAYDQSQPLPAREIAADTFDRSWRDGEGGARELFNSTNGRYEPAPEGRRSSIKPDSAFRKPAVLQRPNAAGPAEPSAAFQSRTSSQMDGSWGRRRGSSVSQGSLPPARRMSTNQRPELAGTPEAPQDMRSPRSARGEPVKPTFAQQSVWDQQMPPQPEDGAEAAAAPPAEAVEPVAPMEDALKVQERVMREKRELAKKRRQEEEEKAEAERRERLKAKLAALEGAGKSKKEREAEAAAAAAAAKEAREKEANAAPAADVKPSQPEPARPAEASASTAASLELQSLPPAPAQTQQKPAVLDDKLPAPFPPKPQAAGLPERPNSNEQKQTSRGPASPKAAGRAPYQQTTQYKAPASSYSSPGDRKPQPAFGRSPNLATDTFSPWPVTGPSSSVWGTSGIGNGTFDSSSAFAPLPMSQQASSLLPPPGMPRGSGTTRISPQGFNQESRSPSLQPQQVAEQQRAFAPPGMETRSDPFAGQARLNGASPAPGIGRQVPHPPGPIGPPSRTQPQSQQQPVQRPDPISAWNNATQSLPAQYAANQAAIQERRAKEMSQPLPPPQAPEASFKETFKKTSAGGTLGGPRRYESTEYTVHDKHGSRTVASHSPAPPSTQTQPSAPFPTNSPMQGPWKPATESAVRIPDGSKNPAHGGSHAPQPPIGTRSVQQAPAAPYQSTANFPTAPLPPAAESKDQSPPPPETDSHPVNQGGDSSHPHVKLPPPQAKVKLPPTSPSSQAAPLQQNSSVLMPQRPSSNWGPPGASRPIVMNEAWQARFNGLFNRTAVQTETPPSPPRTPPKTQGPALAVASSSRAQMDEQSGGATVSLPPSRGGAVADPNNFAVSKPSIDEMFNEELSFGSMPKVRIPRGVHYDTSSYLSTSRSFQFPNSRMQRAVETVSKVPIEFYRHEEGIFVTIRGTRLNNRLCRAPGAPVWPTRNDHQDKKPSGRFNKREKGDKGGYGQGNHSTSEWPTGEGSKKSSYQKPYRQPSNDGAFAEAKDGQSKNNNERRKSTWGKPGRGGRHASAAPSAPVKSG